MPLQGGLGILGSYFSHVTFIFYPIIHPYFKYKKVLS